MSLFIYGTSYNNSNRVKECINSIMALNPKCIFVVDNFSTDGTYEILKSLPKVKTIQKKCSRGRGRQIALENILKIAKEDDFVMYIDLDTIYHPSYISLIKKKISSLQDDEVFIFGMLSKAKINKNIPWRDLNNAEDLERHAHFKFAGYKIVGTKKQFLLQYGGAGLTRNPYYDNEKGIGDNFVARQQRYCNSKYKLFLRMFRILVDTQRGVAFKTFHDFYSQTKKRNFWTKIIFFIAYILANLLGTYSYHATLNNLEYVMSSVNEQV